MAKIPKFKTLEEAAQFWETHDFEDYVADTEPVAVQVKTRRRKKLLTVPLRWKVYQQLGVRPVINAVGTLTTLGGTLMPPEVKQAMEEASRFFVPIHQLQAAVGRRLADLTGAEAAFVTAGASAALCLATCAVTAGSDPHKMDQLPDMTGLKNEIIIQKA